MLPPPESNAEKLLERGRAPGSFGENFERGIGSALVKLGCGGATGVVVVVVVTAGADVAVVGVEKDRFSIIAALPTLEDTAPVTGTDTGVVEGIFMRNEALLGGALAMSSSRGCGCGMR